MRVGGSIPLSNLTKLTAKLASPGGGASNIATVAALVARDIRGNPILEFRQRPFYAANQACRVANELIGSFQREGCPIAIGAVPAISDTTFKTWRDHAE